MTAFMAFGLWVGLCLLAAVAGKALGRYVNRLRMDYAIRKIRSERGAFSDPALRMVAHQPRASVSGAAVRRPRLDTSGHGEARADGAARSADALDQVAGYGRSTTLVFPVAQKKRVKVDPWLVSGGEQ